MEYIFDGLPNFRDMGGVETRNGRKVKPGLLFRSGELSGLSDKDKDYLINELHLKTIIDYRDLGEVDRHPTPVLEGVTNIHVPASRAIISLTSMESMNEANMLQYFNLEVFTEFYKNLPVNNPAYKELVKQLQNGGQPILQHCSAGKDRTGIGAFITFLILDVPIKKIVTDFLLTNDYVKKNPPYWLKAVEENISDPEILDVIVGVKPQYMFYAYDEILNHYDTIADYLLDTYGIDEQERKRIQDIYLD